MSERFSVFLSRSLIGLSSDPCESAKRAPPGGEARTTGRSTLGAINASSPPKARDSDLPRKEVIQPHLPVRLPCYDFVPITDPTFDGCLPCGLAHRLRVLPAF